MSIATTEPRSARHLTPGSPARSERGLVMMSVLGMVLVLTLFAALIMFVAGKETALSGVRSQGSQSLYVAEGGAVAGRAALMAFLNIYPSGSSSVSPNLQSNTVSGWYAGGSNASQNPFAILNYIQIDGQTLNVGANPSSVTLPVNWGSGYNHLKLQTSGSPTNTLGLGTYTATVALSPVPTPDPQFNSCTGGSCTIHRLGPDFYEIFYTYTVTSIGSTGPSFRREVTLQGSFSLQLHLQNFAIYALFTDTHTTSGGGQVWFTNSTSFNGPVHTNTQFSFLQFPTFNSTLESGSSTAWFYNSGSSVQLAANENVSGGARVDAPLVPPASNPQSAAPAAFSRGVPNIPLPTGPYNQQGISLGVTGQTSQVTTAQIAAAIPELNNATSIPNGVYVPVSGSCQSQPNANMTGGIYVQGNVDSLTLSLASGGGGTNNLAVYTFVQGSTTTTVTMDRTNKTTTVNSNNWAPPSTNSPCTGGAPGPATRTFNGVPKGYQQTGGDYNMIIYVAGSVNSLSGTLQQNEQATIAASGDIVIQGNVQYQNVPDPNNSSSNPTNILGLYSSGGNIVIGANAPNNVTIHAILMAGSTTSTASQIYVANYNTGSARGTATVLGGLIEQYYGPFGTANSQGVQQTGYGRSFTYDTRMNRGFSPPFFPTTTQFTLNQGSQQIINVRPTWREVAPP